MIACGRRIVMKQPDHLCLVQTDYEHPSRMDRAMIGRGMLTLWRHDAEDKRYAPRRGLTVTGRRRDESESRLQECAIVADTGLLSLISLPWQILTYRTSPQASSTELPTRQDRTKCDYLRLLRSEERNQPALKGPSAIVGEGRD